MPNTIGTTPGVLIGMGILDTLLEEFPWLRLITTDFSSEQSLLDQPIKIQSPNALTADDYDDTNGYVPQTVSQTEYDLVIDEHVHVTYGFSDTERSKHDIALIDRFARNGAHAIGKRFTDDLLELVKASPFTNSTTIAPGSINRLSYVDLNKTFNGRKVPKAGRFSLLNSDYYATLSEDPTLVSNPGSPAGTVRSGVIGNVDGVSTMEYAFLEDNGEYLAGFAGTAEALLLATRLPTPPDQKSLGNGHIEVITHPETELSLQLRQWYDFRYGKEFRTYTLQYGVGTGDPARLERIVTQE